MKYGMAKVPYVINQMGEEEPFSREKLYSALKGAGASQKAAKEISERLEKQAFPGMRTSDIFKEVSRLLAARTPALSWRFNLKEAMRRLGPTGFHFEKYVAAIFEEIGYKVYLNQFLPGECVSDYEIDFLALSTGEQEGGLLPVGLKIGECKYHQIPGRKVDLEVALANYARFSDIQRGPFLKQRPWQGLEAKSVIVTNTKFSSKAIKYSKCMGVELLGWRYPPAKGLERLIGNWRLYPITILPSLTKALAEAFALKNCLLVKDIAGADVEKLSRELRVPKTQLSRVLEEAKTLLMSVEV